MTEEQQEETYIVQQYTVSSPVLETGRSRRLTVSTNSAQTLCISFTMLARGQTLSRSRAEACSSALWLRRIRLYATAS